MKTILIMCAIILMAGAGLVWNATRLPDHAGVFAGAPKAEVADLIARPAEFLHKDLAIEGIVRDQCTTMGCYFFIHSGNKTLRVDLQEIAMDAPRRNGHKVRVEGQMVPFNGGYQLLASAVEFE